MPKPKTYHFRGTYIQCINRMLGLFEHFPQQRLTILWNDRAAYYAVVDDSYLENKNRAPETTGNTVILRLTKEEMIIICSVLANSQGDLFN